MKNYCNSLILLILIAFLGSCSINTWSDFDHTVEKGEYNTYKMFQHDSDLEFGTNPINKIRIENAVKSGLKSIGLSPSDSPDLLVKYFVKLDRKEFIERCNDTYENYEGGGYCIDRVVHYEQGTLVLDMIDVADNRIIFHGVAEGAPLDKASDPDKKINRMVNKLVADFEKYRNEYLMN
ncbi:MAG: DUF4136 domain-containing protein [Saprospiraceae bacterium]|nr:DUF4136 domain-containing protein [Saprospiraceae bacterium]|tara:strand:- start:1002 stop:1538 length:537 start_codon:yes stop_codon:yes gene_type:complete